MDIYFAECHTTNYIIISSHVTDDKVMISRTQLFKYEPNRTPNNKSLLFPPNSF